MLRRIAYALFLLPVAALVMASLIGAPLTETPFVALGEIWFVFHRESLTLIQPAIERHIHPDLFFAVVEPVLSSPAVMVAAVPPALLLLASFIPGRRRKSRR